MGRCREALRRETGVGAYEKAVSNALELCGARSRGLRFLHGAVSKRLSGFLEFGSNAAEPVHTRRRDHPPTCQLLGTLPTCQNTSTMSALGVNPDGICSLRAFPLMTQSGHRRHVRTAAIPVAEVTDQENQGPREVALENAANAPQNARGLKGRSKD
jgi:hypothetical protein